MHFANCAALAAVLFTTLTQNLRLCSSAKAGIVLSVGRRYVDQAQSQEGRNLATHSKPYRLFR